jgi:hypothetical protein
VSALLQKRLLSAQHRLSRMNLSKAAVKLSELILSIAVTFYSWLLLLSPQSFRKEYRELMIQLFRDMTKDAIRQRSILGVLEVWWRIAADLTATLWEQHSIAGSFYYYRGSQKAVFSVIFLLLFLIAGWLYLT